MIPRNHRLPRSKSREGLVKRIIAVLLVISCVGIIALALRPADAQDQTGDRLSALETRVSALETRVAAGTDDEATYTIHGMVQAVVDVVAIVDGCSGFGNLRDLSYRRHVVVRDETGVIVALGSLEPGQPALEGTPAPTPDADGKYAACYFEYTVRDVPARNFYVITYGKKELGGTIYSFDSMVQGGWTIFETYIGGIFFDG
jgi:hypothetical protein